MQAALTLGDCCPAGSLISGTGCRGRAAVGGVRIRGRSRKPTAPNPIVRRAAVGREPGTILPSPKRKRESVRAG